MHLFTSPPIRSLIFDDVCFRDLCSLKSASFFFGSEVRACLRSRFCREQVVFVGGGYTHRVGGGSRQSSSSEYVEHEEGLRSFAMESAGAFLINLGIGLTNVSVSELPSLPIPCVDCSADFTPHGNIVVVGQSLQGDWWQNELFKFDRTTQLWVELPLLPDGIGLGLSVSCVDESTFIFTQRDNAAIAEVGLNHTDWTAPKILEFHDHRG